jgi:superfamily II DNA/RNA helicase
VVQNILADCLPPSFEPHDYQIEGICPAMDGEDVLVTMATGTGKTGFFILLMLVI